MARSNRSVIAIGWLAALVGLSLTNAANAQYIIGSDGTVEATGVGGVPGYECAWVSCAGALLTNAQGTGLQGCFWDGMEGGRCTGDCSYCSGGGVTTWLCREAPNHTCDPFAGPTTTCGVIYNNPCRFSATSPFPKNMCTCDNFNGRVTTAPCVIGKCQ
jgi:hypothetical protein